MQVNRIKVRGSSLLAEKDSVRTPASPDQADQAISIADLKEELRTRSVELSSEKSQHETSKTSDLPPKLSITRIDKLTENHKKNFWIKYKEFYNQFTRGSPTLLQGLQIGELDFSIYLVNAIWGKSALNDFGLDTNIDCGQVICKVEDFINELSVGPHNYLIRPINLFVKSLEQGEV